MSVVSKQIDVDVPARVAYNQWTLFEDFPRFMEGVEQVEQLDDTHLRWHVNIGGVDRTFEAEIEEQAPDSRIAWRATEGEDQAGVVTFEPLQADRTRVNLEMTYDSDRWTDKVADFLNIVDRRVENDLERFKDFIEDRGGASDGWRGEVDHGQVTESDDGGPPNPAAGGAPMTGTGDATSPSGERSSLDERDTGHGSA